MGCICKGKIPKSTNKSMVLRPNGRIFINGLSDSYEIIYFSQLEPYIKEIEYTHVLERIIEGNAAMWPCDYCFLFGYVCSLFTAGLSFCFPNFCISEALKSFQGDIKEANEECFNKHGLHVSLKRKCCASWIQIDILNTEEDQINEENNMTKKLLSD